MDKVISTVGKNLKYYRKLRGFTLKELAEKSNSSAAYILRIENGERMSPSIKYISQYANALEIDEIDLIKERNS